MTKPVIQRMPKWQFQSVLRMAGKGSKEAQAALDTLWQDYSNTIIPCFCCHEPAGYPPAGTMPLPEHLDPGRVILLGTADRGTDE